MQSAKSQPPSPAADPVTLPDLAVAMSELQTTLAAMRDLLAGSTKSHLSVDEVAALVKRAPYTIRQWVREGRINAERVTGTGPKGRLLIPREELGKLILSGRGAGIAAAHCAIVPVEMLKAAANGRAPQ